MAKITVSLPSGWDNHLIMDTKDFATLCDIFERSHGYEKRWANGANYKVKKLLLLEGTMYDGVEPISQQEFDLITAVQPEKEAA